VHLIGKKQIALSEAAANDGCHLLVAHWREEAPNLTFDPAVGRLQPEDSRKSSINQTIDALPMHMPPCPWWAGAAMANGMAMVTLLLSNYRIDIPPGLNTLFIGPLRCHLYCGIDVHANAPFG